MQDNIGFRLTSNPMARAAMVVHTGMKLRREIESGYLKPLIIMGLIPLCSSQYERLFGTTRIPGQEAGEPTDMCVCVCVCVYVCTYMWQVTLVRPVTRHLWYNILFILRQTGSLQGGGVSSHDRLSSWEMVPYWINKRKEDTERS